MPLPPHQSLQRTRRAILAGASTLALLTAGLAAPASAAPDTAAATGQASATAPSPSANDDGHSSETSSYIVRYRSPSAEARTVSEAPAAGDDVSDALPTDATSAIDDAVEEAGSDAAVESVTAHSGDLAAVRLSEGLTAPEQRSFIAALSQDPDVEYVEPDVRVNPAHPGSPAAVAATSLTAAAPSLLAPAATAQGSPNDEYLSNQWPLRSGTGGIDALTAWQRATGSGVTVAVLDTGITSHPDLDGQLVDGYDFVSDPWTANDGDGRDADPSDPGDNVAAWDCDDNKTDLASTWHGTHVSGIIAAEADNGVGIAGVAPDALIEPVRVLGRCGGASADIVDAITWASGGAVAGAPRNTHPAKVINMSLDGDATCPAYYQEAIDRAVSRGSIIVAASGNEDSSISLMSPSSCDNVITVAASTEYGRWATYSDWGPDLDLAAPGGQMEYDRGIFSTVACGTATPQGPCYTWFDGTSMAAPHVSGIVALMAQLDPSVTSSGTERILKDTATPYVGGCNRDGCGAGVANAARAVAAVAGASTPPTAAPTATARPEPTPSGNPGASSSPTPSGNPGASPVPTPSATAPGPDRGGLGEYSYCLVFGCD